MRAFILTAALATSFSGAFAAAPSTLCPIQGSMVNANCPMITVQNQDHRSCLPGLTGGSGSPAAKPVVERERHGKNA